MHKDIKVAPPVYENTEARLSPMCVQDFRSIVLAHTYVHMYVCIPLKVFTLIKLHCEKVTIKVSNFMNITSLRTKKYA